jgi:diguanylate cyclase (GGDEF)-like protein
MVAKLDFFTSAEVPALSSEAVLHQKVKRYMVALAPEMDQMFSEFLVSDVDNWADFAAAHPLWGPIIDMLSAVCADLNGEFDVLAVFEEIVAQFARFKMLDAGDDPRFPEFLKHFMKYVHKDVALLGVALDSGMKRGRIIALLARHVSSSVHKALEEAESSSHDSLTSLLINSVFKRVCRRELRRIYRYTDTAMVTQLFVDIDKFKSVNDQHGHKVGDRVLQKVAHLIKDEVRPIDIVGRLGGEEMAVMGLVSSVEGAKVFAERIRKRIEDEFADTEIPITVSIGISVIRPNGDRDKEFKSEESIQGWVDLMLERLHSNSDEGMRYVKHMMGRNNVAVFEELSEDDLARADQAQKEADARRHGA